QASATFNISGNGTAAGTLHGDVVDAFQFNIGGNRVLTAFDFNQSTFAGVSAGHSDPTGRGNTFIGFAADFNTISSTGDQDTLLGAQARLFPSISNATAIGANSLVTQNNSLVL